MKRFVETKFRIGCFGRERNGSRMDNGWEIEIGRSTSYLLLHFISL